MSCRRSGIYWQDDQEPDTRIVGFYYICVISKLLKYNKKTRVYICTYLNNAGFVVLSKLRDFWVAHCKSQKYMKKMHIV
jgi:hypothetical protein